MPKMKGGTGVKQYVEVEKAEDGSYKATIRNLTAICEDAANADKNIKATMNNFENSETNDESDTDEGEGEDDIWKDSEVAAKARADAAAKAKADATEEVNNEPPTAADANDADMGGGRRKKARKSAKKGAKKSAKRQSAKRKSVKRKGRK